MEFKFIKETHRYLLDGQELPHITRITSQFLPVTFYFKEARDRGLAVHKAIDNDDSSDLPAEWHGYFEAWKRFENEKNFETLLSERPFYHPSALYAGTIDRYGLLNDVDTLLEIKTGPDHPAYGLQTAAQKELISVNSLFTAKRRYLLQLKDDGAYILHKHNNANDYSIFLASLAIYRWRVRNSIE